MQRGPFKNWEKVTAIFLLLMAGCTWITWSYYYNPKYHYRIKYPQGWEVKELIEQDMVVLVAPKQTPKDRFLENLSIKVNPFPKNATFEKYSKSFVEHTKMIMPKINILDDSMISLRGKPAYRFVYEIREGPVKFLFYQTWILINNKVYMLTFVAKKDDFPVYKQILKGIIKSFEIITA